MDAVAESRCEASEAAPKVAEPEMIEVWRPGRPEERRPRPARPPAARRGATARPAPRRNRCGNRRSSCANRRGPCCRGRGGRGEVPGRRAAAAPKTATAVRAAWRSARVMRAAEAGARRQAGARGPSAAARGGGEPDRAGSRGRAAKARPLQDRDRGMSRASGAIRRIARRTRGRSEFAVRQARGAEGTARSQRQGAPLKSPLSDGPPAHRQMAVARARRAHAHRGGRARDRRPCPPQRRALCCDQQSGESRTTSSRSRSIARCAS